MIETGKLYAVTFQYRDTYYDTGTHIEYGRWGGATDCGERGVTRSSKCRYELDIHELPAHKIASEYVINNANNNAAKAASIVAALNEMTNSTTGVDFAKEIYSKNLKWGSKIAIDLPKLPLEDARAERLDHAMEYLNTHMKVTVDSCDIPADNPTRERPYKGIAKWEDLIETHKFRIRSWAGKSGREKEFEQKIRFAFEVVKNGNSFYIRLSSEWYPFALYPSDGAYSHAGISVDVEKINSELTRAFEDILLAQVPECAEIQKRKAEEEAVKEAKRIADMGGRDYTNDHKSGGHNPFAGLFG